MKPVENQNGGPFVSIQSVCKSYGHHKVLTDVSMDVDFGEVVCIVGPSGSGKSTLLRCINHLEPIDRGAIRVDGRHVGYAEHGHSLYELPDNEIAKNRSSIGMVFQNFNLFPHMSVLENVTLAPRHILKTRKATAVEQASVLLKKVGLLDKAKSYPMQLSGGQQQRVAIARALAMQPKLMLFDEATSALDPELVGDVLGVMKQLAGEGMTMIVVTHEMAFARDVSDSVYFMEEGRISPKQDAKSFFGNPTAPRIREFLKHTQVA